MALLEAGGRQEEQYELTSLWSWGVSCRDEQVFLVLLGFCIVADPSTVQAEIIFGIYTEGVEDAKVPVSRGMVWSIMA